MTSHSTTTDSATAARATGGDFDYDRRGAGYALRRCADPRIAARVHAALGPARSVVNVGAGAGSYEPADRYVAAVEPCASMRAQRPPHLAPAIPASAENLPFDDESFDATMAMLTIHQWKDPRRGLAELRRVSRGPVVVLTFDPEALDRLWLCHYVPELLAHERRRFPRVAAVGASLGGAADVEGVAVPRDCVDGFAEAYYARPERFLDPEVRRAQSAWAFIDDFATERGLGRLRADLESGAWDERYGPYRREPELEGALRLIVAHPPDR